MIILLINVSSRQFLCRSFYSMNRLDDAKCKIFEKKQLVFLIDLSKIFYLAMPGSIRSKIFDFFCWLFGVGSLVLKNHFTKKVNLLVNVQSP